jgi:plasmid maintenance system antidote protein VapI
MSKATDENANQQGVKQSVKESAKTAYLSRSALAEKLGVTLKELTQLLIESGWLEHNDTAEKGKEWRLTAKGEFEGGIYRESKKFGQYIVWPESVMSHAAISPVAESHMNATRVAQTFGVSAKMINRMLADMAWITPYAKGWKLSAIGQANGGVQESNQDTGVPYVVWRRHVIEHPSLQQYIRTYKGDAAHAVVINSHTFFVTLSGHYVASTAELHIANYLYLSGFQYAYQRTVPLSATGHTLNIVTDFYLPKVNIHIHYQAQDIPPGALKQQLERQQLAVTHQLNTIELTAADIEQLDVVLARKLLQLGVTEAL